MRKIMRLALTFGVCAGGALGSGMAHAAAYRVLHSFGGRSGEGYGPTSGPVLDQNGNLLGTTEFGGAIGGGSLYRLNPAGSLLTLQSYARRAFPMAQPTIDPLGTIYVPTWGGEGQFGSVISILSPTGRSGMIPLFTVNTESPLIFDHGGNLVDSTSGSVYRVSLRTKLTTELRYFPDGSPTDGNYILRGRLAIDPQGNFYGGTLRGGNSDKGVVFRLSPTGKETILYSFPDPYGCDAPNSGLILDRAGNLYGTTSNANGGNGATCVFKLAPSGHYTLLHQFDPASEGSSSNGQMIADAAGNLYGTNAYGGPQNGGTLFKLAPNGTVTVLHAFAQPMNGVSLEGFAPNYGLAMDASGNIYGTTARGGQYETQFSSFYLGTVFEYSP